MRIRWFHPLVVGVLLALVLVSIGSASAPTPLVFLTINNPPRDPDGAIVKSLNEQVSKAIRQPVEFKFLCVQYGDYLSKVKLMTSSGEPLDMLFTAPWCGYNELRASGCFMGIKKYLKECTPDYLQLSPQSAWDGVTADGEVWALPDTGANTYHYFDGCFLVRKDLREKYGLKRFQNFAEIYAFAKLLAKKEPGVYITHGSLQNYWDMHTKYRSNPGIFAGARTYRVSDENLGLACTGMQKGKQAPKVVWAYDSAAYRAELAVARKEYKEGIIPHDFLSLGDNVIPLINAGRFAISFMQEVWGIGTVMANCPVPLEWYVFNPQPGMRVASSSNLCAIARNCKNPEVAIKAGNYIFSNRDAYYTWHYGLKGREWEYDAAGDVVELMNQEERNWSDFFPWSFANMNLWPRDKSLDPGLWKIHKDAQLKALNSTLIGFSPNFDELKTEVAQVTAVSKAYLAALNAGVLDEKGYQEALSKWKAAGIEELRAEAQRQLDAWWANKYPNGAK